MAERSLVEILLRARGGRQVASETRQATGSVNKLERQFKMAGTAAGKFGSSVRTASKWALRGGAVIGAGLTYELKRSIDAWEEHAKVAGDVRQVLKTTGGQANVTAAGVDRLSNSLQDKTAVDDDVISRGQAMLLTFLRVRNEQGKGNDVFDRATRLAVDMSARFGTDVPGAFKQLGKALDDPVKGITALRRTGVSFTASEREKIKALEESGHHLQAQKLILAALDKQVGGSAKAQARPIDKLKQQWGDVEKVIGRGVSPAVNALTKEISKDLTHVTPLFDKLSDDLDALAKRDDLSLGQKLVEAGHITGRDLEPLANEIKQGLKDAELDKKLADAIEWAVPKMAEAFATAGPAAVKALVHGFDEAGPAGKLLIAWFTGKKLGLGKLAMGGLGSLFGGGKGGLFSRAAPMPVFVTNPGFAGGDLPGTVTGGKGSKTGRFFSRAKKYGKAIPFVAEAIAAGEIASDAGAGDFTKRRAFDFNPVGAGLSILASDRARRHNPLADYPDSHGGRRRAGHGPVLARNTDILGELVAPIRIDMDGERVADAQAKIRVRLRHRR